MLHKKHWLDDMPNKELIWHGIYDLDRQFKDDVAIALDLESNIVSRLDAIAKLKDEPQAVVEKLKVTLSWLRDMLE